MLVAPNEVAAAGVHAAFDVRPAARINRGLVRGGTALSFINISVFHQFNTRALLFVIAADKLTAPGVDVPLDVSAASGMNLPIVIFYEDIDSAFVQHVLR